MLTFHSAWIGLVNLWLSSEEYSHGFFIVPIALYILWQKREKLIKMPVQGSWVGLLIVVISIFLFLVANLAYILTLKPLSMILFLAGAILYLFGFRIWKECLFPLFMLLFMVPVPSQIYSAATINLQLFVSAVSADLSSLIGVPLFREGNVIHLAERTLQVVQACSGMRSLVSLFALSAFFGYFTLRSNLLRSILFAYSLPIAVLVNIVRVTLLICCLHYMGIDLTHGTSHTLVGLGVFALALIMLFLLRELLKKWDTLSTND
ncbi:MAG: exosortase/archaeosortase family protein [Thermodesulfobacteriota bacterium]|nr:exosortase/archaeosortase family protein [Thermodesulfobacteriota bacterium]